MDSTWITVGVFAAVVIAFQIFKRMGQVSSQQARQLVKDGARLVDVRTPGEFNAGHIPGAVNVPLQELGARLKQLGAKEKPVVLYCASGSRSSMAMSVLKNAGFQQVFNLGGMGRW